MIRQHIVQASVRRTSHRVREVSRLEGFSDAVFGFALTLLVVALEVPRSFAELARTMSGFVGFAACFAVLSWIWFEHFLFFRRYGLEDGLTIFLNCVLLFVVLFYVYPLKFMFAFLSARFLGLGGPPPVVRLEDVTSLMLIYGGGFVAVFVLFALMHLNAYRQRTALALGDVEIYDTRSAIGSHLLSAAVGVVAMVLAVVMPGWLSGASGFLYAALGPVQAVHATRRQRRRPSVAVATR
jgi:hypothetical protein